MRSDISDNQCDYCDDQASHMEVDEVPHYFCDYCHYVIVVEMSSITNFPMYSMYCDLETQLHHVRNASRVVDIPISSFASLNKAGPLTI